MPHHASATASHNFNIIITLYSNIRGSIGRYAFMILRAGYAATPFRHASSAPFRRAIGFRHFFDGQVELTPPLRH